MPVPSPSELKTSSEYIESGRKVLYEHPKQALGLALAARERAADDATRLKSMLLELQALMLSGQLAAARKRMDETINYAEALGADAVVTTLSTQINLELSFGNFELAEPALERAFALEEVLTAKPLMHAGLLVSRGFLRRRRSNCEGALADYSLAAKLFREGGEEDHLHQTLINRGSAQYTMGDLTGALATYLEVRQLIAPKDAGQLLNQITLNVAVTHARLESFELASAELERVIEFHKQQDDYRGLSLALVLAAECALGSKDKLQANTLASQALEATRQIEIPRSQANTFSSLAEVFRQLARFADAHRCLRAIDYRGPEGDMHEDLNVRTNHRLLLVDEGHAGDVTGDLDGLHAESLAIGDPNLELRVLELGVEALSATSEFPKALEWSRKQSEAQAKMLRQSGSKELRALQVSHEIAEAKQLRHIAEGIRKGLERRVRFRTQELREANQQLASEIDERKRTERERHELELSLQRAQRLESLGRLAGGVAHDFNNLLMVVLGSARLLEGQLGAHPLEQHVHEITQAAQRGATLTRELLSFGKCTGLKLEVVEADTVVNRMLELAQRLIGEQIEIHLELEAPGAEVRVDRVQFEAVLLNLIINAKDAMGDRGHLRLASRRDSGSYRLTVEDDGHGIAKQHLDLIFDPFFTTKPAGKGTGLGLSTAYSAMERFGGSIEVDFSSEAGTCMALRLPPCTVAPTESPVEVPRAPKRALRPGAIHVLLVEDEEDVRALLTKQLQSLRIRVTALGDGQAALDWLAECEALPTLIVSDVSMPRLGGTDLLDHIRGQQLQLPMLLVSGWPDPLAEISFEAAKDVAFLQKPFDIEQLEQAIGALLAKAPIAVGGTT